MKSIGPVSREKVSPFSGCEKEFLLLRKILSPCGQLRYRLTVDKWLKGPRKVKGGTLAVWLIQNVVFRAGAVGEIRRRGRCASAAAGR